MIVLVIVMMTAQIADRTRSGGPGDGVAWADYPSYRTSVAMPSQPRRTGQATSQQPATLNYLALRLARSGCGGGRDLVSSCPSSHSQVFSWMLSGVVPAGVAAGVRPGMAAAVMAASRAGVRVRLPAWAALPSMIRVIGP